MIVEIVQKAQYAKAGRQGPVQLAYEETAPSCYAHSEQDAREWLLGFPLFQDATISDFHDGRIMITSAWQPYENSMLELFDPADPDIQALKQAAYKRHEVWIVRRNTVYENVGFEPFRGN